MNIQTISTKELRENFSQVKTLVESGQSLLLLYRSKPLAEIKPVRQFKTRLRTFTQRELKQWIVDDQVNQRESKQIDAILNRLP